MKTVSLRHKIFPPPTRLEEYPVITDLPNRAWPFIFKFAKQLRPSLVCMMCLYMFGMVAFATEPYIFGRLVDIVGSSAREDVWANVAGLLFIYLVVVQIFGRIGYNMGHLIEAHMLPMMMMLTRRSLASYLSSHSYRFFNSDYAGRLAGKVMEMPQAVSNVVMAVTFPLLFATVGGLAAVVMFATMHWVFVLIVLGYFVLNAIMCSYFIPRITVSAELAATMQQKARGLYIDSISNILLVKLFGTRKHEDSLFITAQVAAGAALVREQRQFVLCWRSQNAINCLLQMSVALFGIHLYSLGELTIGQLAAALGLALSICVNFWMLLHTLTTFFGQLATINEALSTIIQPVEVKEPVAPQPLQLTHSGISLQHVDFAYPGREVLKDFNLEIKAGQRIGLVGPSGAGKSTLVQLLLRLYDIQGGSIKIGGQDISSVAQDELRQAIAVIPQSSDLFHRSIFDNIAYGSPNATLDDVKAAAQKAHIHETIEALRDGEGHTGYDSMVGERGVRLSGGQRQRVAIARAFLKNAPLLILDEPTSALDSESERLIQESLTPLLANRTALIIAHRLSTLAHLDRIIVMENGQIREDGTHTELLAKGGLYARLWSLQSEGFIGDTNPHISATE